MSPPSVRFDDEELTLTLTGVGAGWQFGQLGHLRLFDQAQVQFPSSWSEFKIKISTEVLQTQWQLRSTTVLRNTLQSGLTFSLANGTTTQMSGTTELIEHLMARPMLKADLVFTFKLAGEASSTGFTGSWTGTAGFRIYW